MLRNSTDIYCYYVGEQIVRIETGREFSTIFAHCHQTNTIVLKN